MNRVELIGRVCAEPIIKEYGKDGVSARFVIAVQRAYANADGEYDADFISCVAFGKTAKFIDEHLCAKGIRIAVAGHIQTGSYEADDGTKRYTTDVIVDSVYPIDWADSDDEDNRSSKKSSGKRNNRR